MTQLLSIIKYDKAKACNVLWTKALVYHGLTRKPKQAMGYGQPKTHSNAKNNNDVASMLAGSQAYIKMQFKTKWHTHECLSLFPFLVCLDFSNHREE